MALISTLSRFTSRCKQKMNVNFGWKQPYRFCTKQRSLGFSKQSMLFIIVPLWKRGVIYYRKHWWFFLYHGCHASCFQLPLKANTILINIWYDRYTLFQSFDRDSIWRSENTTIERMSPQYTFTYTHTYACTSSILYSIRYQSSHVLWMCILQFKICSRKYKKMY